MKKPSLFLIILSLALACKPSEPGPVENKPIDRRDQFVGTYQVTDNDPNYSFTIEKFDTLGQTWVRVKNFANLFDMQYRLYSKRVPDNRFDFEAYSPIVDNKTHKRWVFQVYTSDTVRNNCLLTGDTLRVFYRIHNIPWWGEDDTTGIDRYIVNTGIKQH